MFHRKNLILAISIAVASGVIDQTKGKAVEKKSADARTDGFVARREKRGL